MSASPTSNQARAVNFLQSGTEAIARTMQAKAREIVSATDFGATGNGSTDDTVAIQAAIDAAADGGTVQFPSPTVDYKFSTLTVNKCVTLQGAGWQVRANQAFGHADWANTTYQQGSILRSTATSGAAITCDTTGEVLPYNLRDIAIIGPGSGTSTGIALGSASQASVMNDWQNVMVANFSKGYNFTNVQDSTFVSVRERGCTTGFEFNEGTNQNAFFNAEGQFSTDAFHFVRCGQNDFFGGITQNNTDGLSFKPSVAGALEALHFYGMWMENNTNNVHFDTTDGTITGILFQATRATTGTAIAYTSAGTVNFPRFIGNQWTSLAVTLGSGMVNAIWLSNNSGTVTNNGTNTVFLNLANTVQNGSTGQFNETGGSLLYTQTGVANRWQLGISTGRVTQLGPLAYKRVAPTYGTSVAIDADLGNEYDITVTDGVAFTVANPSNAADGQRITITVRNGSGGAMGVITWDTLYKMSAWTNPADTTSRSIDFKYNGTNWVQVGQTGVDVPN
jgi:hypothetical protein